MQFLADKKLFRHLKQWKTLFGYGKLILRLAEGLCCMQKAEQAAKLKENYTKHEQFHCGCMLVLVKHLPTAQKH